MFFKQLLSAVEQGKSAHGVHVHLNSKHRHAEDYSAGQGKQKNKKKMCMGFGASLQAYCYLTNVRCSFMFGLFRGRWFCRK